MTTILLLIAFWGMQAAAMAAFGWGAATPGRWLAGFILGNTIGISSTLVLMRLYTGADANLAYALGVGGAFIAGQLALAALTRQAPVAGQWVCISLIGAGMMGYALLARPAAGDCTAVAASLGAA